MKTIGRPHLDDDAIPELLPRQVIALSLANVVMARSGKRHELRCGLVAAESFGAG